MTGPSVPLPQARVSEWTAIRIDTAAGLFAYRHMQAVGLLELPDFGGGDLTAEQRRGALRQAINFKKPLAALALFLGVVALEDFIRDVCARLAEVPFLQLHFPDINGLRSVPMQKRGRPSGRPDKDPASLVDPEKVNNLLQRCLGIEPLPALQHDRVRDLFLLRHTVAHHAAIIRSIDVPRFQYYIVQSGQSINPPRDFIEETLAYLYSLGRTLEDAIKHRVFSKVIPKLPVGWRNSPPTELIQLIEMFDYFGNLVTANGAVGYAEPGTPDRERAEFRAEQVRQQLIALCLLTLERDYSP